jgi:hypothetical protein
MCSKSNPLVVFALDLIIRDKNLHELIRGKILTADSPKEQSILKTQLRIKE